MIILIIELIKKEEQNERSKSNVNGLKCTKSSDKQFNNKGGLRWKEKFI